MRAQSFPWGVWFLVSSWTLVVTWGLWQSPEQLLLCWEQWGFHPARLDSSWPLQGLSAQFFHADLLHWMGNSAYLLVFGVTIERRLGSFLFLLSILWVGWLGFVLSSVWVTGSSLTMIGSSGAVSGALGLCLLLSQRQTLEVWLPLGLFMQRAELPMWIVIGSWVLVQLILIQAASTYTHVTASVHVVGFICGVVLGGVILGATRHWPRQKQKRLSHV